MRVKIIIKAFVSWRSLDSSQQCAGAGAALTGSAQSCDYAAIKWCKSHTAALQHCARLPCSANADTRAASRNV